MCKANVEDVNYIISAGSDISARYYLPLQHDAISKVVYKVCVIQQQKRIKMQMEILHPMIYLYGYEHC